MWKISIRKAEYPCIPLSSPLESNQPKDIIQPFPFHHPSPIHFIFNTPSPFSLLPLSPSFPLNCSLYLPLLFCRIDLVFSPLTSWPLSTPLFSPLHPSFPLLSFSRSVHSPPITLHTHIPRPGSLQLPSPFVPFILFLSLHLPSSPFAFPTHLSHIPPSRLSTQD